MPEPTETTEQEAPAADEPRVAVTITFFPMRGQLELLVTPDNVDHLILLDMLNATNGQVLHSMAQKRQEQFQAMMEEQAAMLESQGIRQGVGPNGEPRVEIATATNMGDIRRALNEEKRAERLDAGKKGKNRG